MTKRKLAVTSKDKLIEDLVHISDHKVLAVWAADCAERVLPYFEDIYSDDNRPRKAIEAARAWVDDKLIMTDARKAAFAAHASARSANENGDIVAVSSARSAGHAAATAHVASHAIAAAKYAVTAIRDVTNSDAVEETILKEREWQYDHLLELKSNSTKR